MAPANIAIVVGSTRPGRNGAAVARWIQDQSSARSSATYEIVDLEEVALPLLNQAVPALLGPLRAPAFQ